MLKNKIKVLAIDLDETLTNYQNKISPENREAILASQKKGIKVVIVTGRSLKNSLDIVKKIDMEKYEGEIIFFSGAATYSLKKKKITNINPISKKIFHDFNKNPQTKKVTTILINKDFQYFCLRKNIWTWLVALFLKSKIKKISQEKLNQETVIVAYMLGRRKNLQKIINNPENKKLNFWSAKNNLYEFNTTSKGEILQQWAQKNQYQNEEIMVFGNGENDYSLFQIFKHSIAVKNAIPKLKKIAFDHTTHWKKNGVAKAIQKYLL